MRKDPLWIKRTPSDIVMIPKDIATVYLLGCTVLGLGAGRLVAWVLTGV